MRAGAILPVEAGEGQCAAGGICELGSGSLREMGVASLPENLKPASVGKDSIRRTSRAAGGGSRQSAQKEPLRTFERPGFGFQLV